MSPNSCWVQIGNIKSWDVVYLAMTVMLQSVAATAAAPTATVLGTSHTHEAAGHGQLRGLGKVGQDASSGVGQASLQGRLRLRGLAECMVPEH